MEAYRVYTETGFTEFLELPLAEKYHVEFGIGEIEPFEMQEQQLDKDEFVILLSTAFDAKFETYWKAKGYFDLHDLNNHSVDTQSKYHTEALSLIRWANKNWDIAVSGLNENSNIEDIINSLEIYI